MAEIKLDPVLGELSPNIFKAAIEAGLPNSQQTQLNQMAHARKEAKRLLQLSKESGRKEFLQFDPIVQDNIRYLYSKEDRFAPELTPLGRGIQAVGKSLSNTAKLYFSPIIAGFTAADKYYKTINTPYQVEQQAEQRMGKRFSKKLITEAFDGKNSWRWDKISEYEAKHGKALVTLVRGISEGRTPGESIDLYGTDDESMVKAIQFMGDEPEQFNELLKEIKTFAQVSPGRDKVGSMLKADPEVNQSYWATKLLKKVGIDLTDKKTRTGVASLVSGPLDATYQIGIDPLTYTGAGPILKGAYRIGRGIKGIPEAIGRFGGIKSRGERLADQFVFLSERGNVEGGVDFVFKQADVIKLWDEQLGKVVKNYADAEGPVAKGLVYKQIRIDFPEWANLDVVKKLAKEEVFDATSAKRFFMDHEDMGLLLSGRVDNLNYRRNGIPVAKNFRSLTSASHKVIDAIFNPTAKNLNLQSYLEKGEKELSTVLDVLKKVADDGENLVNPAIKDIIELQTDISKTRKMMKKMSVGFTRSPGRILYGEDAIKTESDVRNLAMLALGKKDTAYAFTEQFLTESPEIQLTMIRNLYAAVMMRSGMLGSPKGQTIADEILAATFNETGMFSTVKSQIPLDLVGTLHPALVRREGEDFFQASKGIVQPSQVARSIAPLPYDLIYQTAASSRLSEKVNFINVIGGATRNKFSKFYMDFWTNHTLFPRLGPRSAVDEAFFGFLTQSTAILRSFLFGGRGGRSTLEAATGSKTTQGMYKRGFYKILPSKDPTKKLDNQERLNILEDTRVKLSKQYGYEVPLADVAHQAIREETLLRVQDLYAGKMGPTTMETVTRLMKYNPNVLDSMGNSVAARSMMTGKIDIEYVDSVFVSSNLTKAVQEAGLALGKKYRAIDINKMTTKQIALAHFDNWNIRFSYNSEKIANGAVVNPVNAFYRYKALKTNDDFVNARHSVLKDVGVERVPKGFDDDYIVASGTKLDGFLSLFSTTVLYRQRGIPDVQIARIHVENMLMDMRNTFHGGPTNYNEKLFEAVKASKLRIETNAEGISKVVKDPWSKASAEIDFTRFEDLTQGYQPGTNLQTRLYNLGPEKDMKIFEEETGFNHLYSKWQNWTMDVMDATVTGIYRQPMLLLFTERALKDLKPYEKVFKDRYVRNAIEENPLLSKGIAEARGKEHAERQVTNLALTRATEELLEYVDNPSVRTNFAISIRSVGRFYRATEDFYRRVWRLYTKKPLQSLYRLRLLHTGLEASGDVYEDEKGDKFIIFPTDSIINGAVEPILRTLTGNSTINVPSFNEFTLKLRLLNPSFSPDAGQPALAGPIASVGVVISRALLRELPFVPAPIKEQIQPSTTQFAEKFDSIALGQFGDRMTFRSALVPMFLDSIFGTLSPTEWDRQKGTAMLQAIAWGQAFGNGLPTNATTQEKADYISKLKLSVNSTIVARNMLGQISPGQPTLRDSKELPEFLKKTGITTWKSSFYDVYNGLLRNAENEDTDVFDLAIATWVGQNPGKVIYLVPRNTKEFKVLINTTDEVKNWSIKNKKFIDTYKEIGYLFAPKAGEYNPDIYAWMQSEGLVDIPEFQDYLEDVQVAEDKQKYFAIEDKLNEALKKKSVYGDRRQLIDKAAQERTALLISNPYLDAEISGKGTNRGNLKVMFKTLSDAVADPKSPIDKQTRSSMNLAIRNVADFLNLAEDPELSNRFDFSEMKSNRKQQVVKILTELSKLNPEVKEANRIIFTGLLNYYSRESVIAGIEGR
jgi:hypothetical protein